MIISDRMDANKKSKMLPRDQKLLPKIGVILVFQKYLKLEILLWVAGSSGDKVNSALNQVEVEVNAELGKNCLDFSYQLRIT